MDQNEIDKYLDGLISKAEKEIDRIFIRRQSAILREISSMYEKYSDNGFLTLADMSKYNRLQKSLEIIVAELVEGNKEAFILARSTMETQFIENFFRSAFLYEFEAQKKMGFGAISKEVIQAALDNPIKEMTLNALMQHNRDTIVRRIRTEIAQGLVAGESYDKIAKRIRQTVAFNAHKARMVARTESGRAQTLGRMKAAEQASKYVKMQKMWDAALGDSRTRPAHRKLDGTVKEMDEMFVSTAGGKGLAPRLMHSSKDDINCRCAVIYLVNGRKPSVRRMRNEDGTTSVVEYQTYEDWKKNRLG